MTEVRDVRLAERFAERFVAHVAAQELLEDGARIVVGVSGGLDSVALLHLLRFAEGLPRIEPIVAHFDHALRDSSRTDARWVGGLARAWGLPFVSERAARPPADEAEARDLRHGFLERVRTSHEASVVLTAHHMDDQAETVLFRILRGTGLRGLRGMESELGPRVRPLLPFSRLEIEDYAQAVHLAHRDDPTNRDPAHARNVVRHELLPRAEAAVAPGARRALVRLARNAARAEAAWEEAEQVLLASVSETTAEGVIELRRSALLAYGDALRGRLLRAAARSLGVDLSEAGTRVAMEFSSGGESGGEVHLQGGLRCVRDFDRLTLEWFSEAPAASETILHLADATPGTGEAMVGGRRVRLRWGPELGGVAFVEAFAPDALRFPLRLRSLRPGDRIRLGVGSKKLVKLMAEVRLPRRERTRTPVLADAGGRVLWVPGLARSVDAGPATGEFFIGVEDADDE